jgi:PhzF family phenazine biosynthesis protein
MKFYIADAFTESLFGGNPAGVVILGEGQDFPSDEVMVKTAAELRYSETAFIKPLSENEFNVRYFTPAAEVDLCGHATIASFYCLLDAGLVHDGGEYTNKTLAGDLSIKIQDGFIMMEMGAPEHISTIEDKAAINELYDIMGVPYESELLPMLISTGLPDIMMPVPTRERLAEIKPDFDKLSDLSKRYDAVGVHAFTLDTESDEIAAHCRNFAPLYDIDEEAATGTSNGALTYYMYINDLLSDGATSTFIQGEAMDRPSAIMSELAVHENNKVEIKVGGSARILATGEINL